jgi:mono/diheme cytochrome c family protein
MKYYLIPVIIPAFLGILLFFPGNANVSESNSFRIESRSKAALLIPGDQKQDKGVGPVKELKLGPVDKKLASQGQQLFSTKCVACHSLDQQIIGPPLRNVTKRRTQEYIMNMILNPTNMEKEDPVTRDLHKKYIATPMTDQGFTQDQARALLEYLRSSEK